MNVHVTCTTKLDGLHEFRYIFVLMSMKQELFRERKVLTKIFGTKVFKSGQSKFFKGCFPQNLLGPLLNTLSHLVLTRWILDKWLLKVLGKGFQVCSRKKKILGMVQISFCLLDPQPRPEGSYKIGSVRPPFRLSVSFLGIGSLVFSET